MKCPHCDKEIFGRGHNVEGLYEEPKELTPLEKSRVEIEQLKENNKNSFCYGFCYGLKYGYEGVLADGPLPDNEINPSWIMASMLFDKIGKALKNKADNEPT